MLHVRALFEKMRARVDLQIARYYIVLQCIVECPSPLGQIFGGLAPPAPPWFLRLCGMCTHSGTICPSSYGSQVRHQVVRDVTRHFNPPFGNLPGFEHRRVIHQKTFQEKLYHISHTYFLVKVPLQVHVHSALLTPRSGTHLAPCNFVRTPPPFLLGYPGHPCMCPHFHMLYI